MRIFRDYSDQLEEYSIDEAFFQMSGTHEVLIPIIQNLQHRIDRELNFSVSFGIASTKVLAKVASKWHKPHGICSLPESKVPEYLKQLPLSKIWGIGPATNQKATNYGLINASDLYYLPFPRVQQIFPKPIQEIYQELHGISVLEINPHIKDTYDSISKTQTFVPTIDARKLWIELLNNLERACTKSRRYHLHTKKFSIFLKTQKFEYLQIRGELKNASAHPLEFIPEMKKMFTKIWRPRTQYRSSGVILEQLQNCSNYQQLDLFTNPAQSAKIQKFYQGIDQVREKYGDKAIRNF